MRGAAILSKLFTKKSIISIHAPHAGSGDCQEVQAGAKFKISIHAPHAGSGMAGLFEQFDSQKFQSTLPMRGAALHNKSF